ncbi:MAG: hypothetical protein JKY03_06895, partial [Aureispira sp.]|nr:hypothetical protein [Aureispira sp.]
SLAPSIEVGPKAGEFVISKKIFVYGTVYKSSGTINDNCPNRLVDGSKVAGVGVMKVAAAVKVAKKAAKAGITKGKVAAAKKAAKGARETAKAAKVTGIPATTSSADAVVSIEVNIATPFVQITSSAFEVQEVSIVIHNGLINEITAVVKIGEIEYIFDNPIPIGISSIQNLKVFNKYYLRCRDPLKYKVMGEKLNGEVDYVINLRDLLEYIPEPSRNVLDKSPRNKTHTIVVKDDTTMRTVYKEPVSQLIQASIFSDFMGIEENKPNGLIQTEIYRRINLYTLRNQLFGSRNSNWGILQYLRPEVSISKVEDKERVLYLDYLTTNINGQEQTHAYASSIDLHLYQYMRAGSLFNLALFQNPDLHTTIEVNTGFYFGMVPLKDSLRLNPRRLPENNEYTAVTLETFLETTVKFSMNKYLEFSMSYTPFLMVGLGKYYTQVKDRDNFVNKLEQGEFWDRSFLGKAELLLWVKPAPNKSNGRFFGRYRFIHQLSNPNLYYHQIQVGYSFYLEIPRPKS